MDQLGRVLRSEGSDVNEPVTGTGVTAPTIRRLSADRLRLVLLLIAVATVFSGLAQVVAPGLVLRMLSVPRTVVARQLFATIGMFMVLFGGILIHALLDRADHPIVVFWTSLQKFGASGAVIVGVVRDVFAPVALGVATFDLVSGVLGLWYWRRIH
jgi:hypothetical protein